jgi:hypothetical protein
MNLFCNLLLGGTLLEFFLQPVVRWNLFVLNENLLITSQGSHLVIFAPYFHLDF